MKDQIKTYDTKICQDLWLDLIFILKAFSFIFLFQGNIKYLGQWNIKYVGQWNISSFLVQEV